MYEYDEFNFDVSDMIQAFDFEKFILQNNSFNWENGAYLIITDNQLIMGYTRDFGKGPHEHAIANAVRVINGFDFFDSTKDTFRVDYDTNKEYIKARILNEKLTGKLILFDLYKLKSISENQYKLFEYFYEKYNEVIKRASVDNDTIVHFSNNKFQSFASDDLTLMKEYLKTIIDYDKEIKKDKKIIGISIEEIEKKDGRKR